MDHDDTEHAEDVSPHVYSTRERKALIEKISKLSSTEHEEILKIIKEANGVSYSQNRNGVFINFRNIANDTVARIHAFVDFCFANNEHLDEYDKRINECKFGNKLAINEANNSMSVNTSVSVGACSSSQPLNQVMNRMRDITSQDTEWQQALKECKAMEKVETMIDVLENNISRVHKKKTCNMKFSNAKKKYARRSATSDKKCDIDLVSNLIHEPYLQRKIETI